MPESYLMTWNEDQKKWPDLPAAIAQVSAGGEVKDWWNVANTGIQVGDRLFLLKQGKQPTGFMGSATAISSSNQKRPHYDSAKRADGESVSYVDFCWNELLDPQSEPLLLESDLLEPGSDSKPWNSRNSGNKIDSVFAHQLESHWQMHLAGVRGVLPEPIESLAVDEDECDGFPEGKEAYKKHKVRERSKKLIDFVKARAIRNGKTLTCGVCDFDFKARYGEVGEGYIEGHHTKPLSTLEDGARTMPDDIALVCANCHRMLHRRRPWLAIDELKSLLMPNPS